MIRYEYKREDGSGISASDPCEAHRLGGPFAQRYLKRVHYGNRTPFDESKYLFEIVFDYGEHDLQTPSEAEAVTWPVRSDPFSTYRGGFEVRTYRLCRRVLAFHKFDELGAQPVLTQSIDLTFDGSATQSKLLSLASVGYIAQNGGGYSRKSLPPVSFTYAASTVVDTLTAIDIDSSENAPSALADAGQFWLDLYREALPGLLTATDSGWYFKRNLGSGKFAPLTLVDARPAFAARMSRDLVHFADIDGDGSLALVCLDPGRAGFQRIGADGWGPFTPFASWPAISPVDPQLRLVDIDGDGRVDLLQTSDDRFSWYLGLGPDGFQSAGASARAYDEERGPTVTFREETQSVFLADMSGDGLADIVRIHNGEIVYWPNLGYGRFGAKVTMSAAPLLDDAASFDPGRIRLADIAGTGCADLLYLGRTGATIYFNQSGNGWSTGTPLPAFPAIDDVSSVEILDLLGTGTPCVVWSTKLPAEPGSQLSYLDLYASQKPNLLVGIANNLGRESMLSYAPSTKYYLADRAAGTPWASTVPFVVQTLESLTVVDHIMRRRFTSHTTYHHAFYDHVEREFAGFGRTDRYDTELVEDFQLSGASNVVEVDLQQPPVLVRTWRHPGSSPSAIDPVGLFSGEYFQGGAIPPPRTPPSPDPMLSVAEWMQYFYALRGAILRQETYSDDASPSALIPYTIAEHTYGVVRRQPISTNRYAVFSAYSSESLTYQCERNAADPRISHVLTLALGDAGEVLQSATVTYGRQTTDLSLPAAVQTAQAQRYVSVGETDFTTDVTDDDTFRLRVPCEQRGWDLLGAVPKGTFFIASDIVSQFGAATVIAFDANTSGTLERRLISRARRYYLTDDLSGLLPLKQQGALGLNGQGVSLSYPAELLTAAFGANVTAAMMTSLGYVHSEGDADWWSPTPTLVYPPGAAATFYRPSGARDVFGNLTQVTFDTYALLPTSTTDALNNVRSCTNDYRTLKPSLVTDQNGNRTQYAVDELGFVTAIALLGKVGSVGNDTLASPTQRFEYDATRWSTLSLPTVARTYSRERQGDPTSPLHVSYAYSDGGGGIVATKIPAEPGLAGVLQPDGTVKQVDTTPNLRYVGNGRRVVNNKGMTVREFEPYFSASFEYEDASALVDIGYSSTYYYDPVGRLIRTDFPNGTHAYSTFTTWSSGVSDPNDAVLTSAWYTANGSPDPNGPEPADPNAARHGWRQSAQTRRGSRTKTAWDARSTRWPITESPGSSACRSSVMARRRAPSSSTRRAASRRRNCATPAARSSRARRSIAQRGPFSPTLRVSPHIFGMAPPGPLNTSTTRFSVASR